MAMSAARSSVFTFESVLHSSHVLRCLDEQRRRDTLCDVTVVVEGRGFRAHRSVLASCSDYFAQRTSSLAQHGAVVTLPREVTAAGFEPLLKFAYTCKLHFDKDNVLDIRSTASFLGFRDLDEACFDFLLPKFLSASKGSAFVTKTCCENKCRRRFSKENCDKEVRPVAESSPQQEVALDCHKSVNSKMMHQSAGDIAAPAAEGTKDPFVQCPKYRKFQLACGKETCATEKSLTSPASGIRGDSVPSCFPLCKPANREEECTVESPGNAASEPASCPLGAVDGDPAVSRSQQLQASEAQKHKKDRGLGALEPGSGHQNTQVENDVTFQDGGKPGHAGDVGSAVEMDAAQRCDSEPGPDEGPSWFNSNGGRSADTGGLGCGQSPPSEWPPSGAHRGLGLTASSCPFFGDVECPWKPSGTSECEGASQSGVSSVNSGEDGDSETETEGDSESSARERARQVQLPFPVDRIVTLNRNDFQTLLKQHVFTQEQLDFVHDMRRRSKNRLAAQRCRKRKLDCIYNLQCEINKLKTEREKLIMERSQLSQLKLNTCHSVTTLCQRVCSEANLQAEQLQVLAKYTSSDCPLSSFLPHIDALLPLHPQASLLGPPGDLDKYAASEEETSGSSRDRVTGRHSL